MLDRNIIININKVRKTHTHHAPGMKESTMLRNDSVTTFKPDEMCGTDATLTMLLDGQQATIFGVYDHCTCEFMGVSLPSTQTATRP
jgi:hypothetical protein